MIQNLGIEKEKKMKSAKVNDGLIDRELRMISPELLLGYEKKSLHGRSLREMNRCHGAARRKIEMMKRISGVFAVIAGIIFPCSLTVVISVMWKELTLSVAVFIWVAAILYSAVLSFLTSKGKKAAKEAEEYEQILGPFTTAVENLFGIAEQMTIRHEESNVRSALVFRATKVLKLEEMFNDQISLCPPNVEQIVGYGEWLMKSRGEFGSACCCAESFGLDVDRGEVYSQARQLVKK